MIEDWKSLTRYQKWVIGIYLIIQLPLFPLMIILIPFCHWVAASANAPYKRLSLMDYASFACVYSLFIYLMAAGLKWCPP